MNKVIACIAVLISVGMMSCNQKSEGKESNEETGLITESGNHSQSEELKTFYIQYVKGCETGDKELLDSLNDRYITKELLKRFQKAYESDDFLEYDPILNAQDCFAEMLKGLEVIQDTINSNIYTIVTDDEYREDGKLRITLLLKEEEGVYKIDKILSDPGFR